jgi:hypothetical protein
MSPRQLKEQTTCPFKEDIDMKTVRIARRSALAGAAAGAAAILARPFSLPAQAPPPRPDLSGPQCIRWQKKKSLATFTGEELSGQVIANRVTLDIGLELPEGTGNWRLDLPTKKLHLRTFHSCGLAAPTRTSTSSKRC